MEPAEKFIRRFLTFILMIVAFVVSFVLGEVSLHMGWLGILIFFVGAAMGAFGVYLWKSLRS